MTSRGAAFEELVEQMARLRDPVRGCPWDRAQDHKSLRPYLLEEAYEAIGAIDAGDPAALCDELGDVLLQVVLHAQIAFEAGEFEILDVVRALTEKLMRRHPHVFGDACGDLEMVRERWHEIKATEDAPQHLRPPLLDARKLVESMADRSRIVSVPSDQGERDAGQRILEAVASCCERGYDPELALRKAIDAVRDNVEGGVR